MASSAKRFPYLLSFVREMRVDAHRRCRIGMSEVLLRGENIHAGAVEDGSVVVPEVVRREDGTTVVAFDARRAFSSAAWIES